jgi:hypothetical protein
MYLSLVANKYVLCVNSGLHRGVNEIFACLELYAVSIGS